MPAMGENEPTPDQPATSVESGTPPASWAVPDAAPASTPDQPPAASAATPTTKGPSSNIAIGGLVLALVACGALAAAYVGERSTTSDLRDQVAELETAATTTTAAAEEAVELDLEQVARDVRNTDSGVDFTGSADSLTVDVRFPGPGPLRWVEQLMEDLDMPADAIVSRMGQTRALDGTQEASGGGVTVTWTYHPDDGLSAVFSVD